MSLDYIEWQRIKKIDNEQTQQLVLLKAMSQKQDRQIELLEKIISVLSSRQDDGR